MVYQDDPGGSSVEIPQYHDDPVSFTPVEEEYGIAPQPVESRGSSGGCSRCKVLLCLGLIAALMAVGGYGYYDYNQGGSSSANIDGGGKPLFTGSKVGVRGKPSDSSNDDGMGGEVSGSAPAQQQQQPNGDGVCKDDPTWVHDNNGKTCEYWVQRVGQPSLRQGRCNQSTGNLDDNGEQLLVKHYCKRSCGLCEGDDGYNDAGPPDTDNGDGPPPSNSNSVAETIQEKEEEKIDYVEELAEEIEEEEEEEEEIEAGEGIAPAAPVSHPTPGKCEDDPTFVHTNLKKCASFVAHVGRPLLRSARCGQGTGIRDNNGETLLLKHFCRKSCSFCEEDIAKAAAEAEMTNNEYVGELEELKELGEVPSGESNEEEKEESQEEQVVKEPDSEIWEDLKEEENEAEEEDGDEAPVPGRDSSDEDSFDYSDDVDFFVPLTTLERDALKERLRGILGVTKHSMVMKSAMSDIQDDIKDTLTLPSQRTFVLDPESPKLFMHLQHNETGSERIGGLISCALDRQKEVQGGTEIKYSAISEGKNLDTCINDLASRVGASYVDGVFARNGKAFDPSNKQWNISDETRNACDTTSASVMSYCSSLSTVRNFGWNGVESIATFANPVEQTHHMYQVTAQSCYACRNFGDVLKEIHDGTFTSDDEQCTSQMIGHQAVQLLTSPHLIKVANDVSFPKEEEIVEEAVRNLRERITWIGISEKLQDSVVGFRAVFPWLSVNLNGAAQMLEQEFLKRGDRIGDDANFGLPENYIDKGACVPNYELEDQFQCGSREVDGQALIWIAKLNMRDLAVYKAAVERFAIQKEVLEEYKQSIGMPDDEPDEGSD